MYCCAHMKKYDILCVRSLETVTHSSFYNSRTEHNIEMKLTSINFSHSGAKGSLEAHGCKLSATDLSIVPHALDILTANATRCIILL